MLDSLFVETAFAQGAKAAGQPSTLELFGMPIVFLVIMYFLIIRPQQKKQKEQQELVKNLKAGDEVVTTGGIIGRIRAVSDNFVTLDSGSNSQIKVQKHHVTGLSLKQQASKK